MRGFYGTLLTCSVALLPLSFASAQTDRMAPGFGGEATIYRDYGFQGPAVAVSSDKPNLGLAWPVRSIRVRSGSWELCPLTNYRGNCVTVTADESDLRRAGYHNNMVQSMRVQGARPEQPIASGASLKGMAAEFFPQPAEYNGRRVLACTYGQSTAACAATTADRWCKLRGWAGSARQAMETVGRRIYLADTLCTRTGY